MDLEEEPEEEVEGPPVEVDTLVDSDSAEVVASVSEVVVVLSTSAASSEQPGSSS